MVSRTSRPAIDSSTGSPRRSAATATPAIQCLERGHHLRHVAAERGPSTGRLGRRLYWATPASSGRYSTALTFSSSAIWSTKGASRSHSSGRRVRTSAVASGWRTLSLLALRAARPRPTTRMVSRVASISDWSISATSATGQSVRWTLAGAAGSTAHHQVLVQLLGQERHEGRQQAGEGGQRLVEGIVGRGLVRVVLALPEAAPAAAHVPVGEQIHEGLQVASGGGGVVAVQGGGDALDGVCSSASSQRSRALRSAAGGGASLRVEAVQIGVEHEEGIDVPEGEEEAAAHLLGHAVAEAQVGWPGSGSCRSSAWRRRPWPG